LKTGIVKKLETAEALRTEVLKTKVQKAKKVDEKREQVLNNKRQQSESKEKILKE